MKIILCEGKNDAIFFDELVRSAGINQYTVQNNDMKKLYELFRNFNYIANAYNVIIYGDNGKPTLLAKVTPNVLRDVLGKASLTFVVVVDDGGLDYETEFEHFKNELEKILRNRARFPTQPVWTVEEGGV